MPNFRIGQKVVCVDVTSPAIRPDARVPWPIVGDIYTVTNRTIDPWSGVPALQLSELPKLHEDGRPIWYQAKRFRPAVERKTDISVFQKILDDARTKAPVVGALQ